MNHLEGEILCRSHSPASVSASADTCLCHGIQSPQSTGNAVREGGFNCDDV